MSDNMQQKMMSLTNNIDEQLIPNDDDDFQYAQFIRSLVYKRQNTVTNVSMIFFYFSMTQFVSTQCNDYECQKIK